jgi:outer membrane biogenesis lipoprotein LolB
LRSYLPALALLSLLASCATPHDPTDLDLTYWRFGGKLSIQEGGRSRVLNIDWQQRGDSSDIHLNGPLGIGDVHIRAIGNQLVIDTGGSSQVYPLDQDLVIEGDSFRLPWKRLAYWVQGLQGSDMVPIEGAFLQDDWSVSILDSDNNGPILMVLSHPEVRLRLKVHQWQRSTVKGTANQI